MEEKRDRNVMVIFEGVAIRDAGIHQPDPFKWVDGFIADRVIFGIVNDLNVNVSVQPIGRAGGSQGNLGSATTINANTEGVVNLNLSSYWAPFISATVTAASSPASGKITVYSVWRERETKIIKRKQSG